MVACIARRPDNGGTGANRRLLQRQHQHPSERSRQHQPTTFNCRPADGRVSSDGASQPEISLPNLWPHCHIICLFTTAGSNQHPPIVYTDRRRRGSRPDRRSCYQSVLRLTRAWSQLAGTRRRLSGGEQWGRAEWDAHGWIWAMNQFTVASLFMSTGQLIRSSRISHTNSLLVLAVGWRSMRSKWLDSAGDTQLHLKTWSGSWRLRSCSGFCGSVATRRVPRWLIRMSSVFSFPTAPTVSRANWSPCVSSVLTLSVLP